MYSQTIYNLVSFFSCIKEKGKKLNYIGIASHICNKCIYIYIICFKNAGGKN